MATKISLTIVDDGRYEVIDIVWQHQQDVNPYMFIPLNDNADVFIELVSRDPMTPAEWDSRLAALAAESPALLHQ